MRIGPRIPYTPFRVGPRVRVLPRGRYRRSSDGPQGLGTVAGSVLVICAALAIFAGTSHPQDPTANTPSSTQATPRIATPEELYGPPGRLGYAWDTDRREVVPYNTRSHTLAPLDYPEPQKPGGGHPLQPVHLVAPPGAGDPSLGVTLLLLAGLALITLRILRMRRVIPSEPPAPPLPPAPVEPSPNPIPPWQPRNERMWHSNRR